MSAPWRLPLSMMVKVNYGDDGDGGDGGGYERTVEAALVDDGEGVRDAGVVQLTMLPIFL